MTYIRAHNHVEADELAAPALSRFGREVDGVEVKDISLSPSKAVSDRLDNYRPGSNPAGNVTGAMPEPKAEVGTPGAPREAPAEAAGNRHNSTRKRSRTTRKKQKPGDKEGGNS